MTTEQVYQYMQQYGMTEKGEVVAVGLSGGADSVCLLSVLRQLSEKLQIRLMAIHVDHGLRGAESDADRRFVEELCHRWEIPLFVYRFSVAEIAKKAHLGLEEAGRSVRQKAFSDCMKKQDIQKIALAHHANDLAETMLFRAARGTSLLGMAGIRPVNGRIIRPLLGVKREEIVAFLSEREISWREDSSNAADAFARNRIRHEVIPCLEEAVNPQTVRHLAELAQDMADADTYLRAQAQDYAEAYGREEKNGRQYLLYPELLKAPLLLQGYVVLHVLEKTAGVRRDLGREQIRQVLSLFGGQSGRQIDLPYGLLAVRDYDGVRILPRAGREETDKTEPVQVTGPGIYRCGCWRLFCRVFPAEGQKIPQKTYTKWFDYDKIKGHLTLRNRETGDYLTVNAEGGRKKLKDYLINEKVPRRMRDGLLLLASGQEILWIVGYRIGESGRVTEKTKRIMELRVAGFPAGREVYPAIQEEKKDE